METLPRLRLLLPSTWSADVAAASKGRADATITLKGPGNASALLDVAVKLWTTAPTSSVTGVLAGVQRTTSNPVLLVTDYTNRPLRKACEDPGISYLDEAGWAFIKIDDPPIFIRTEGTDRPAPRVASEVTRLNGVAVGRIIRTLLDIQPPVGNASAPAQIAAALTGQGMVAEQDHSGCRERTGRVGEAEADGARRHTNR